MVDASVPDGTIFNRGESFVKGWVVRNDGECDWPESTVLVFVDGDQMGAPDSVPVGFLAVGERTVISVEMTAPNTNGRFRGSWQLADGNGNRFGGVYPVQIEVSGE